MPDITIEGHDALHAKLGQLEGLRSMKGVLMTAGMMLKDYIAEYPAATEVNTPGGPGSRWYQRGYGPKWMRKDGAVNGIESSQALGRRWTVVAKSDREVLVGNSASYAPYVQSAEKQAGFHKRRGWRTDEMAIKEMAPKIERMAAVEVKRMLGGG